MNIERGGGMLERGLFGFSRIEYYCPISNILFLSKVCKHVVARGIKASGTFDHMDPFKFGSQFGLGTETALVALVDNLCWERE